ncbi:MAG: hypothetical protein M0R77_06660 [Gammaproteobacteria bacterium]|jgi:hypothetical protein|nr:hypothetical protein [Gammaproteobacteria bacterium]
MSDFLQVQVESHADCCGDETPRRLHFGGRSMDVEVIDRWEGAAHRYFKLRGNDGGVYIVRHEEGADVWALIIYDSGALDDSRLSS